MASCTALVDDISVWDWHAELSLVSNCPHLPPVPLLHLPRGVFSVVVDHQPPQPITGDVETPARGWLVIVGHSFFAWFQPELCWLLETLARLFLPSTLGWLLCALQLLQGLTQNRRLCYILDASLIIYSCAFLSSNLLLALKSKIPEKQHWAPTLSSGEAPSSGPVLPCWPWGSVINRSFLKSSYFIWECWHRPQLFNSISSCLFFFLRKATFSLSSQISSPWPIYLVRDINETVKGFII